MNAPFPVTNYLSTIQVREGTESNTSLVEWSGTFTPVEVSDEEAINLFHGIYSDGLKALRSISRLTTKTMKLYQLTNK